MATFMAKCTSTVETLLRDLHLTDNDINHVVEDFNFKMCEEVMKSSDLFLSEHQRQSVYTKLCQVVEPLSVILGYTVVSLRGKKESKRQIGYYILLRDQLEKLLDLPEVWNFFRNPCTSNDGIQ